MVILLCGLQSPINIGMILRTAELFGWEVQLCDRFGVMGSSDNVDTIRDFSCGALDRGTLATIAGSFDGLELTKANRLIAASGSPDATPHREMKWRKGDWLLIGNEYDGLPDEARAISNIEIRIPVPNGYFVKPPSNSPIDQIRQLPPSRHGEPSLNASVATGIILASAFDGGSN
ncbi:TrmH family RNA methyltransferase [Ruegeria sp. 2205SS24-7]|uniref:TrmH family RNA methyltransferase n=1 Tax=Ruegeria discodermiae TaxID=3064389 RepID=UPI00274091C1|nr:TrmH family RNA methyltransferase [Ruegeria sp. 2205SS24-7]MDP5220240.1 TrmH family RNA methyltransferase [Ruegeria sp. 2205SS24-7]